MGIQGLLPFLANSTRDAHISEFENMYVGIDAYCWLHKGIYSCAFELAMKKPTTKYITYCMRYVEMLLHFNVKPVFVFDGRYLSSKQDTEKKRREERKKKKERGKELIRAGKVSEGRKLLGESVDVTHEIAGNLIRACREKNIDCIVAPFEADAQLAYLSIQNIVQCVITEDSDLLAYGCERVLFKMDMSGRGKLTEKNVIHLSMKMTPEEFSEDLFRYMCILSGCDYLPSLTSIGPATALKFIKLLKEKDIYEALPRLPVYLNKMNIKVTPEYIAGFKVADNTFKHQLVYDPLLRRQVPLRPVSNDDEIVGAKLPDDLAFQLALGNLDPFSMQKVDSFDPDMCGKGFTILWKTDLLPNATPRLSVLSSSHKMFEGRKRQRDGVESDSVQPITNDLKKQRLPLSLSNFKNSANTAPKTGFLFEPRASESEKKVSKTVDESKLLKSRYFSKVNDKKGKPKLPTGGNNAEKDENYEDYLRRLYDEYFPGTNSDETEKNEFCCEERSGNSDKSCLSCGKCKKCCDCNANTQKLDEYVRELEEAKKSKKPTVEHFLLDEIYRKEEPKEEKPASEIEIEEKVSPGQRLSIDFSKILSKFDKSFESEKTETVEKENEGDDIILCESTQRSPSPVFKVQKEAKTKNCSLGNISDTASTPTSVYFAASGVRSLDKTISSVPKKRTPLTSHRKTSSSGSFSSKPGKETPVNRTLFQFGFKKQRKEEKIGES